MKPRIDLLESLHTLLTITLSEPSYRERFNMDIWIVKHTDRLTGELANLGNVRLKDTHANAVGWAIELLPDWQEVFEIKYDGGYGSIILRANPDVRGTDALIKGLCISETAVYFIFNTISYRSKSITPNMVAFRIKKFITTYHNESNH